MTITKTASKTNAKARKTHAPAIAIKMSVTDRKIKAQAIASMIRDWADYVDGSMLYPNGVGLVLSDVAKFDGKLGEALRNIDDTLGCLLDDLQGLADDLDEPDQQ